MAESTDLNHELRRKMHQFIDYEMDFNSLGEELLVGSGGGDRTLINELKRLLHKRAEDMDLLTNVKVFEGISSEEAPEAVSADERDDCASDVLAAEGKASTKIISLQNHLIDEAKRAIADCNRNLIAQIRNFCIGIEAGKEGYKKLIEHLEYHGGVRKPECDMGRSEFLDGAKLKPPPVMRVIDIEATCKEAERRVVLLDYWAHEHAQQWGYSAISHTYGMEVYSVFNCSCATSCSSASMTCPRCWDKPCPHLDMPESDASKDQRRVVDDILRMCTILKNAGVMYAWHDGVCIAQFDEENELNETIQHMGGLYANAKETIIFLHYVGNPIAPIKHDGVIQSRWQSRVWTLQEAAFSQNRRYCVRVCRAGLSPFSAGMPQIRSLEEFDAATALWYKEDTSQIEVIDEKSFLLMLGEVGRGLFPLFFDHCASLSAESRQLSESEWAASLRQQVWMWIKGYVWFRCIQSLIEAVMMTCLHIPTIDVAIRLCSARDSKHVGDRINSILALTQVTGFVAPKEEGMEASILEFYLRQGWHGMRRALLSINVDVKEEDMHFLAEVRRHQWLPLLWRELASVSVVLHGPVCFQVLQESGRLELTGAKLLCVGVKFMVNLGTSLLDNVDEELQELDLLNVEECVDTMTLEMELMQVGSTTTSLRARLGVSLTGAAPSGAAGSCGTKKVQVYVGDATFTWYERQLSAGIMIGGARQVTTGEAFQAHLVLPMVGEDLQAESARLAVQLSQAEFSEEDWPFLVVQAQGDHLLRHPAVGNHEDVVAAKIGRFQPTHQFVSCCLHSKVFAQNITVLDKLVVM
ncbi:hypothetical protein L7F22_035777 [Adiantum nelumboides]|nr:hypothetical protein [Adiantum nelumboides]